MARKGLVEKWLKPESLELIAGWCRQGLSDEQIAHNMGIDVRTLYRWKKKHDRFCQCLEENKEVADLKVENALFKRATGYVTEEVTYSLDETGNLIPVKKVQKEVVPDVTAQKYWLTVRSQKWREGMQDAENPILNSLLGLLKAEKGESDG